MPHPILQATADIDAVLKQVADVNPVFLPTSDKEAALRELVSLEARLVELRLRLMATADDVAETTAAHDVAEWLTVHARARHEDARAELRLARSLDTRWAVLAAALRDGEATLPQAQVIARALDDLPAEAPVEVVALAETTLVAHAAEFGPRQLARLGRRILDVVAPEIAEAAEARRLAALEDEAHRRTRLSLRRVGDGTTRLSGLLPDAAATRLATYLEAFTNPRKTDQRTGESRDPLARRHYPRRLGEAFCQLMETLDPARLPLHGGDATTLVVTIPFQGLLDDLAVADLTGGQLPGDDPVTPGDRITAAQARRLACTAQIIPVVLGGESEILDLGRSRRLFTAAQRKALRLRDRGCRAEGCTIPAPWCEAHHLNPWSRGGRTDLADGLLLCHHHHHRAHDPGYATERLPTGDLRYHRRR
ncbi:DUF222 domain-containing protein [Nocardioides sp.]|uniref:HNH endonuclease signature motif containing protein n=1 Tax=Nocardioides sp. TaxID=35761 RepID=UPI0035282B82